MASITPAPKGFRVTQDGSSEDRYTVIGLTIMHDDDLGFETTFVVIFDHETKSVNEISTYEADENGWHFHLDK
jgi:hypothetical protein